MTFYSSESFEYRSISGEDMDVSMGSCFFDSRYAVTTKLLVPLLLLLLLLCEYHTKNDSACFHEYCKPL